MPGALTRRLGAVPDYFVRIDDDALEPLGMLPGDLAAISATIRIGDGAIVLARDGCGTVLYRRAVATPDHEVRLTGVEGSRAREGSWPRPGGSETSIRIEGVLVGSAHARRLDYADGARGREAAGGDTPDGTSRGTLTGAGHKRAPTERQAQVLELVRAGIRRRAVPPSLWEMALTLGEKPGTIHGRLRALERKGLIKPMRGVDRGYCPTEPVGVPIVDVGTGPSGDDAGLDACRIIDRVPDALAEPLEPRPDLFIAPLKDGSDGLGLERRDLMAVRTGAEASDGEMVVARVGEDQRRVVGVLRRRDERRGDLQSVTGARQPAAIVVDARDRRLRIEGVVIGSVTFRDLEPLRGHSGGGAGKSGM